MKEVIIELLNSSSDKIAFFGGIVFLLVAIFCSNPVKIWKIQLPSIDVFGRIFSVLMGLVLFSWVFIVWTSESQIALISAPPDQNSVVLKQNDPEITELSNGENIGALAYNISSGGATFIALFELGSVTIPEGTVSSKSFLNTIESDIVWNQKATQGEIHQFNYRGNQHTLSVDKVYWYLFGPDYVVATIQ